MAVLFRPARQRVALLTDRLPIKATRHRYAIRGYISTAATHGISVFTALRDELTRDPWMPPIPAST